MICQHACNDVLLLLFMCSKSGMIPIVLDNDFHGYKLSCVEFVSAILAMTHTELSQVPKACEILEACEQSCI